MEFLTINENKLKIMLSSDEVKKYGIENEKTDYRNGETRKAFWKILDRANEECGFKVRGDKLLIQYYPSKSGAEIFVTRLGKISLGIERNIAGEDSITMLSSKNMIYRFENIEVIERLRREISRNSINTVADLYHCEDGCYYLFFEERSDAGMLSPFSVISEFGDEIPQNMESYIKEHSEPVSIGNAFEAQTS